MSVCVCPDLYVLQIVNFRAQLRVLKLPLHVGHFFLPMTSRHYILNIKYTMSLYEKQHCNLTQGYMCNIKECFHVKKKQKQKTHSPKKQISLQMAISERHQVEHERHQFTALHSEAWNSV